MRRRSFKMKIKPGCAEEYKRRHDELWPELHELLKEAGIREYSIFLDEETGELFAFQKIEDEHRVDELPKHSVMRRWWNSMKDLMETNPDHSPVETPLEEVFYLS